MAHFIPSEFDETVSPHSEAAVWAALEEHLSNEWIVFHSLSYVVRKPNRELADGEVDFALYHARHGLLVVEVKGGGISYVNGQWLQNGQPIDPFGQARRGKYAMLQLLEERLNRSVPLKFAHAVCFPDLGHAKRWPLEAEGLVITGEDFPRIEEIACRLLEQAPMPDGRGERLSEEEVLNALSPEFEYGMRVAEASGDEVAPSSQLRRRLLEEEEWFFRLSEEQCSVLTALRLFPRLQVQGGAGTGKTVLAVKKAMSLAAERKRVLLLCFNEVLARRIRASLPKIHRDYVTVGAFFEFCVRLMGIPQAEYDRYKTRPELYTDVLPGLLEKFLSAHEVTFDGVIVDEGQDFSPEIWRIVPRFVASEGAFYIFYDPDQNIFRNQLHLPDFGMPPVVLTQNCRNTRRIFEALKPYYHTVSMTISERSPLGAEVITRIGDCRENLLAELTRLVRQERVNPTSIVILGGHSLAHTSIGESPCLGEFQIVENPTGNRRAGDVAYYTYMKFKGCEAKVVILLDVEPGGDPRWDDAGMYTAMSRASSVLIVLRKG